MLIQRCIYQPGASGGVSKFGNFEITIVNPNDEAVKEIMAMPRALKISFSTAIKTRRLDLQLKADGEAPSSPPQPHDVAHSGMLRPPPTPIRNMGQAAVHPPDERGPIFPHGPDIARGPALTSSQATNMAQPLRQLQLYSAFYPPEQTPNFAHGQPPAFQAPNFAPQPQYGAAQLGRAASFP
ncbi:hypothetical protein MMC30_006648 [Trapelia coarctata]|nr:hypothetical protein [Trapelia coarctata]